MRGVSLARCDRYVDTVAILAAVIVAVLRVRRACVVCCRVAVEEESVDREHRVVIVGDEACFPGEKLVVSRELVHCVGCKGECLFVTPYGFKLVRGLKLD